MKFTIRDKGKEQYQYLIDFNENKTPGLSNTVASNLLRTDQASYDDSIRNPDEIVNHKSTTESTGNPGIRNKVSAGEDAAYMRAVNSWDKETEQKMVDESAFGANLCDNP